MARRPDVFPHMIEMLSKTEFTGIVFLPISFRQSPAVNIHRKRL
jgi:hypothetical protein